jgi:hypothetical protein
VFTEKLGLWAVVAVAIIVFVFVPWVSLDSDVDGIFWAAGDAAANETAEIPSGLDLVQADSFTGTQPTLLLIALVGLALAGISIVVALVLPQYRLFDPYVRFVAGAAVVLCVGYAVFVLLTGEVGSANAVTATLQAADGEGVIFVIGPTDGEYYSLRAYSIGSDFEFKPADYMGPNIGSLAVLVAGIILAVTGTIPTRQNVRQDWLRWRMARMTDEQRLAEARRIWDTSAENVRRSAVMDALIGFMTYEEVYNLLAEWKTEGK